MTEWLDPAASAASLAAFLLSAIETAASKRRRLSKVPEIISAPAYNSSVIDIILVIFTGALLLFICLALKQQPPFGAIVNFWCLEDEQHKTAVDKCLPFSSAGRQLFAATTGDNSSASMTQQVVAVAAAADIWRATQVVVVVVFKDVWVHSEYFKFS